MKPQYKLLIGLLVMAGFLFYLRHTPPPIEEPVSSEEVIEGVSTAQPLELTEAQLARAQAFEADPKVVTTELEETTTQDTVIPGQIPPPFIQRMEQEGRTAVKVAKLTVEDRTVQLYLGDRPEREFYLYDVTGGMGPYWWGAWNLYSYHKLGDHFYEFALLDDGHKVGGRRYTGALGTFKIGKGGRDLEKIEFRGSVMQEGRVSAPVGTVGDFTTDAVGECQIPVGDYTAYYLAVTYDNLRISISHNYHTNAQGKPAMENTVYGMSVRQDTPYVLDFSNDPVVVFDQPALTETSFARGQEIEFAAVLVDPKLDVMIRGLDDSSVKEEQDLGNGETYQRDKSLDPTVVISRANGEVVAEGTMPFG